MSILVIVLYSTVFTLAGIQTGSYLLEFCGRSIILLFPASIILTSFSHSVSRSVFILFIFLLLFFSLISSSINPCIGIILACLSISIIVRKSYSGQSLFFFNCFWLLNLIFCLSQIIGFFPFSCFHSPWASNIHYLPFLSSHISYLPLGQLRPPGIFPTQIHFIYLLWTSILFSIVFLSTQHRTFTIPLLLLNLIFTGSQTVIFGLVLIFLFTFNQSIISRRLSFSLLSVYFLYNFAYPYTFHYNFSDVFVSSSFFTGRTSELSFFLLIAPFVVPLALVYLVFMISRSSFYSILISLVGLFIIFTTILIHPLFNTLPGPYVVAFVSFILMLCWKKQLPFFSAS